MMDYSAMSCGIEKMNGYVGSPVGIHTVGTFFVAGMLNAHLRIGNWIMAESAKALPPLTSSGF
jgi:hypothetical protein